MTRHKSKQDQTQRWAHSHALVLCRGEARTLVPGQSLTWSRGVTVSTLDSESSDRGSNPREALGHGSKEARTKASMNRHKQVTGEILGTDAGVERRQKRRCWVPGQSTLDVPQVDIDS